jgi:hypothetical protein
MTLELLWGEVWRIGLTLGILLAILAVWALMLPSLTPFPGTFTPSQVEAEKAREHRYRGLHKWSVRVDVLFFVWLVVEGFFLVPYLFTHYGLR